MKNDLNLCPNCGSKNIKNILNPKSDSANPSTKKWFCPDCGFDLYCNVAAAVGCVIFDSENNIILETRAKNPRKGFLALPGGFVDADETAEEAVLRECREEIGLEISEDSIQFLCTFPNTYEYKNIVYKTCDMFFSCRLPAGETVSELLNKLKAEESEVTDIKIFQIKSEEDIDKIPIAFPSGVKALKTFLRSQN